jgi:hypothetical protein
MAFLDFLASYREPIVIGVIASLLAIALQVFVRVIINVITDYITSRLRLKKLYDFKAGTDIFVVSGSIDQSTSPGTAFLAGPDATAAANVVQSLRFIYRSSYIKHYYATKQHLAILNENVVTVGGPLYNHCTAEMLDNISPRVYFDQEDNLIFREKTYSKSQTDNLDYGLVIRHRNPFSPEKKVMIVAGCGSHGVLASSMLFEQTNRFPDLYKDFARKRTRWGNIQNRDFMMVVQCHMSGNDVSNLAIVDFSVV